MFFDFLMFSKTFLATRITFYTVITPHIDSALKKECELAAQKVKFCRLVSPKLFGMVQFDRNKIPLKRYSEYNSIFQVSTIIIFKVKN